jgi:ATP-binding cassette subfamily B protein
MGIVSSSRIINLLDSKEFLMSNGTQQITTLKGEVAFEHVWFSYKEGDYVLKDVSFSIQAGQTVALVGATGAGKSSVISLLNRFYDIQRGVIRIDGQNIHEFDIHSLRRHIGVVLQDVFLFSDSIRSNITLGNPDITDEMILQAADEVGALKFIERLPGKLDYQVMERGSTLSVGQRQLLSFIRAMVYHPRILILDEATSSVDSETEAMIQEAISRMMRGRTSIVIAHRLSTIQKADRILVMEKGEVRESGRHEELLEKQGLYAQLYRMQYKEVI